MNGITIWFTGSKDLERIRSIAAELKTKLSNCVPNFVDFLDEQEIDEKLCSNQPKDENFNSLIVKRLGWICKVLTRNDAWIIAYSFSPVRNLRNAIREEISNFMEVFFEDNHHEYEEPYYPEVTINKSDDIDICIEKIVNSLKEHGYLLEEYSVYSDNDTNKIKDRLEKLGYL